MSSIEPAPRPETAEVPLLPCPFCGSSNVDHHGWASNDGRFGPACDDCSGSAETAERWNSRPHAASPAAPLRCKVTNNPCGTDTWTAGGDCHCISCIRWRSASTTPPAAPDARMSLRGWLIREANGGWLWTGARIAAVAALTEGLDVVSLAELASLRTQLAKAAAEHSRLHSVNATLRVETEAALAEKDKRIAEEQAINEQAIAHNHRLDEENGRLQQRIAELEAGLAEARAALLPFAQRADDASFGPTFRGDAKRARRTLLSAAEPAKDE